jgi:hypothetical protein
MVDVSWSTPRSVATSRSFSSPLLHGYLFIFSHCPSFVLQHRSSELLLLSSCTFIRLWVRGIPPTLFKHLSRSLFSLRTWSLALKSHSRSMSVEYKPMAIINNVYRFHTPKAVHVLSCRCVRPAPVGGASHMSARC